MQRQPFAMVSGQVTSDPSSNPSSQVAYDSMAQRRRVRLTRGVERIIFFFFLIFVAALPHSIKGAQHAWRLAFLLWLVYLGLARRRPFPQPLTAPLLAYITLSSISTALTADPILSWDRMKIVGLVLVGVLFAQNLKRLSQVRVLVLLLLLSALAVTAFTGWQYTYGIGVEISQVRPGTPLAFSAFRGKDIITHVNGHRVNTPAQLIQEIAEAPSGTPLQVLYVRGFPLEKQTKTLTREDFLRSGLGSDRLPLARGKPTRAEGHLKHYVVFAEMLMQLACLAWAMLLSTRRDRRGFPVLFGLIFLAVTTALMLTETRAAMAGLALGCFVAMIMLTGRRSRIWASAALLLLVFSAVLWTHFVRHVQWIDLNDPGTHFRVLMWEDGLRLVHQHPWFGIGMESVRTYWRQWNIRGFAQYHVVSHFHCTFLQIAVDRGLTTLAAWMWFVVAYIVFLVRTIGLAKERSRFAAGVLAGVLAGFVAFQVTSLVHYNLGEEPLVTILFFYFGLAIAIERLLKTHGAVDVP
jgi:O-antigen ligase